MLVMTFNDLLPHSLQEEQAVLDKIVKARKASLAPGIRSLPVGSNPHILVSGASIGEFDDRFFYTENPRRCSTQSVGPIVVPVSSKLEHCNTGFK